jgi:competence protein ComEA
MTSRFARIAAVAALCAVLGAGAPAPAADEAPVNLNTATAAELEALPGVGPSKAKAIVDYRSAHPFQSVEELMNVRGIGEATFEDLRGKITVGSASTAPATVKR